ncbi:MAG TPA: glycine--tRNA ligase subunit beta [Chloroflexota bacterium]|nr:glycine--tRNA ligase subunit beta [Chloroflexota bacterium]
MVSLAAKTSARAPSSLGLTFQDIILRLQQYWAQHGCLIWQPANTEVGAGTMNPATFLRVLGPEPWNVAYVEPSVRPDDSRYGENPNRIQMHTQFQVILKPDPGNPQELYLGSLEALGIDYRRHDVRFVEDNWESPALGAWGLGWEVWLDGQEITQFTYFQQAGGVTLDPVAVEITYGLERIAMTLQGVRHFKDIRYAPGITYGEVLGQNEYEMSVYNLDLADVERAGQRFTLYEQEAKAMLAAGQVLPAYSYILKTSHTFNILDTRGAIGVTERARYFARMRDLARDAARRWLERRQELGFPLGRADAPSVTPGRATANGSVARPARLAPAELDFVLEIGSEELPAADVDAGLAQLAERVPAWLAERRLAHGGVRVDGTPRRLVVRVAGLQTVQADETRVTRGPSAAIAFDAQGQPTRAAEGFARRQGIDVRDLRVEEVDGGRYAVARVTSPGRPALDVLAGELPELIATIQFPKSMRWDASNVAYARPLRWLLALLGDEVVPFEYAGLASGRTTYGLRPDGSPPLEVRGAAAYGEAIGGAGIILDREARAAAIRQQARTLAEAAGGTVPEDPALLAEVTNLVEAPTPLSGRFKEEYLSLPREVLVTVMRKHQRYFPVQHRSGEPAQPAGAAESFESLLPCFITVANGPVDVDTVRQGNEEVLTARYADAAFFWEHDRRQPLEAWRPKLAGLTFQAKLGSMLDKSERIERLTSVIAGRLGLEAPDLATARRVAHLAKADLVTTMVVEFTSLQGIMGQEYARHSGEPEAVARGIFEHYLPRYAGDRLPSSGAASAVGIADRLDSLTGLFAAGLAPRATADPFALRRTALGLVQLLAERGIELDLRHAVREAAAVQPIAVSPDVQEEVLTFIRRRLERWLLDRGARPDVVQAVLAARGDDPARAAATVRDLGELVDSERFQAVLTAYSRPARIIRGQEVHGEVDPAHFEHDAERALWAALGRVAPAITPELAVPAFVTRFEPLVEPIDTFFEQVFVMAEDERVRRNRLRLLKAIADLPRGIVDLTQLRGF